MSSKKAKGTVRWFNATKGTGFVTLDHGNEYIFFKSSSNHDLSIGDSVEFEVRADWRGRPRAFDITASALTGDSHSDGCDAGSSSPSYDEESDFHHGIGCSHNNDHGSGYYISGIERDASLTWSEGTALPVFDEMLPSVNVWDEQTEHSVSTGGGLLDLLACGGGHKVCDDMLHIYDELEQQPMAKIDADSSLAVEIDMDFVDKEYTEISRNVVWDNEFGHDLNLEGLLLDVALGGERKLADDLCTEDILIHQLVTCAVNLDGTKRNLVDELFISNTLEDCFVGREFPLTDECILSTLGAVENGEVFGLEDMPVSTSSELADIKMVSFFVPSQASSTEFSTVSMQPISAEVEQNIQAKDVRGKEMTTSRSIDGIVMEEANSTTDKNGHAAQVEEKKPTIEFSPVEFMFGFLLTLPMNRPWDPGIITATAWGQAVFRGAGNVMTQIYPVEAQAIQPICQSRSPASLDPFAEAQDYAYKGEAQSSITDRQDIIQTNRKREEEREVHLPPPIQRSYPLRFPLQ